MRFFANSVSGSASGDYYQFLLETEDSDHESDIALPGQYLLIQAQFEFSDGGECYVESDDVNYIGHFRLKLIEFTPTHLAFEIARKNHNRVEVGFALTAKEFEMAKPVVEVIFGEKGPILENSF